MTERIACPIFERAKTNGKKIALVSNNRSLTYRQFNDTIDLKPLDVKPRERVAIISANTVEYIVTLFALWRQGAIACLLSTRLPQEGSSAALKTIACARTIFIPGTRTDQKVRVPNGTDLSKNRTFLRIMPRRAKVAQFIRNLLKSVPFVRVPGNKYALNASADIMFTSGSSGEPKAVAHSFGNHYHSALAANERIPVREDDRWLLSLPLYHVGGLGIIWRTFLAGATVVVPDTSADLADSLRKFNITHVSLVPTQLHRLLSDPKNFAVLQKMKAILIGGSAIPDALLRKAIDASLPVHVTYGLTEMASQVATSKRLTKEDPLPAGQILRGTQIGIAEDNEILVKGKTLFQGYVKGEKIEPALDKQGWFHTGDLGCLNEDGTLTVLGRKDNMFISGGENIQPEEIERHLCHIEGILQAVVVPVKNEEFGERPVAFLELREGAHLSKNEILSFLRQSLPSFKLPEKIYVWPPLAQQQGIKYDRSCFRRLAENASSLQAIY